MNDRLIDRLFPIPGVVSLGWGYKIKGGKQLNRQCLVVGVERKRRFVWPWHKVPIRIGDFETDVVQVGEIMALQDRRSNHRPAPGGVSIGHYLITAGTLGCLVKVIDKTEWHILSNNHILANSNVAEIGDPIYQRAPADGGTEADKIAELKAFKPIKFGGAYNYVDCAIALPLDQSYVSREILEIGVPTGYAEAGLGDRLKKSGRTTGLSESTVQQVRAVVQVAYPNGQMAYFQDQILTGNMSAGGDSGSVVLDMQGRLVGLLFAGSPQITVVSRFQHVVDALNLDTSEEPEPPPDELCISAFYRFSDDADWTLIGRMEAKGFEHQLAWSTPKAGVCKLKGIAEEGGRVVGEAETGDFTVEPGVTIKLTWIYPQGGEAIKEGEEITLRLKVERV